MGMPRYLNGYIGALVDEMIHSKRDREILRLWYVDGIGQERIAKIIDMSPQGVKKIIHDCTEIIRPCMLELDNDAVKKIIAEKWLKGS